jgi:hypothetical protein
MVVRALPDDRWQKVGFHLWRHIPVEWNEVPGPGLVIQGRTIEIEQAGETVGQRCDVHLVGVATLGQLHHIDRYAWIPITESLERGIERITLRSLARVKKKLYRDMARRRRRS